MTTVGGKPLQRDSVFVGDDLHLDILCYEEDETTPRVMTGGAASYLLTFEAESTDGGAISFTKTNATGIEFGVPDANSVRVSIEDTDVPTACTIRWALRGTDLSGDNQFTAAAGERVYTKWP